MKPRFSNVWGRISYLFFIEKIFHFTNVNEMRKLRLFRNIVWLKGALISRNDTIYLGTWVVLTTFISSNQQLLASLNLIKAPSTSLKNESIIQLLPPL